MKAFLPRAVLLTAGLVKCFVIEDLLQAAGEADLTWSSLQTGGEHTAQALHPVIGCLPLLLRLMQLGFAHGCVQRLPLSGDLHWHNILGH